MELHFNYLMHHLIHQLLVEIEVNEHLMQFDSYFFVIMVKIILKIIFIIKLFHLKNYLLFQVLIF